MFMRPSEMGPLNCSLSAQPGGFCSDLAGHVVPIMGLGTLGTVASELTDTRNDLALCKNEISRFGFRR